MKNLLAITALIAFIGYLNSVWAAGDPAAGKTKSTTKACIGCHLADGNSGDPQYPKLAGQHSRYTLKQLQEYKTGVRANAIMAGMATPLNQQDMEDLAAYFATQETSAGEADPELVELGESLFQGGDLTKELPACAGCHSPTGMGNPAAQFPRLAGQHAQYIKTQLKAFRAMERANDAGQMMRNIAVKMSDQEIEAVASYIQGLRP